MKTIALFTVLFLAMLAMRCGGDGTDGTDADVCCDTLPDGSPDIPVDRDVEPPKISSGYQSPQGYSRWAAFPVIRYVRQAKIRVTLWRCLPSR
jgi:hypothetical protein